MLKPPPRTSPSTPPAKLIRNASIRNCIRMSREEPPSALRRPISRVRSSTEVLMMFRMPNPATTNDTEAATIPTIDTPFRILLAVAT